jgi:TAT (twin-arginine translocation) pathway signal sequence
MNRRGFLKGLAGLAALACAPSIPAALVQTEQERLLAKMATGLVENEIFYLDGPVTISGVNNLIINRCIFKCKNLEPNDPIVQIDKCNKLTISNCSFVKLI